MSTRFLDNDFEPWQKVCVGGKVLSLNMILHGHNFPAGECHLRGDVKSGTRGKELGDAET